MAKKNPHAVALGKKGGRARMDQLAKLSDKERKEFHSDGGKAGGKARKEKLSPARRKEIARAAGLASAAARRKESKKQTE